MIYRAWHYENIAKAKLSFSSPFGYDFSFGHFSWKRDGQPPLWLPFFTSPEICPPKTIELCDWFLLWKEWERVNLHKFNIGSYGKIYGGLRPYNREFWQEIRFDFGISVFTFVGFCNAEFKSLFLLRFISVAQGYSSEQRVCLNEPLKRIFVKIKTYYKAKTFIPKSNLFLPKLSIEPYKIIVVLGVVKNWTCVIKKCQ